MNLKHRNDFARRLQMSAERLQACLVIHEMVVYRDWHEQ